MSFDSILNVAIPVLLILVVVGFFYIKFFEPYILPMFKRMYENAKEKQEEKKYGKEIMYE